MTSMASKCRQKLSRGQKSGGGVGPGDGGVGGSVGGSDDGVSWLVVVVRRGGVVVSDVGP